MGLRGYKAYTAYPCCNYTEDTAGIVVDIVADKADIGADNLAVAEDSDSCNSYNSYCSAPLSLL